MFNKWLKRFKKRCGHKKVIFYLGGKLVPEENGSIYLFERCEECGELLRKVSLPKALEAVPYIIVDTLFKSVEEKNNDV